MKVAEFSNDIINETSDENIVKYLLEKIYLSMYSNTKDAKKYGVLTAALMVPNCMEIYNNIKTKLESMDKTKLRFQLARNILNRNPIHTDIIDF